MESPFIDRNNGTHLQRLGRELQRRKWTAVVYGTDVGATLRVSHPAADTPLTDTAMSASVVCPQYRAKPPSMFEWAHGGEIGAVTEIDAAADAIQAALTLVVDG